MLEICPLPWKPLLETPLLSYASWFFLKTCLNIFFCNLSTSGPILEVQLLSTSKYSVKNKHWNNFGKNQGRIWNLLDINLEYSNVFSNFFERFWGSIFLNMKTKSKNLMLHILKWPDFSKNIHCSMAPKSTFLIVKKNI